LKSRGHLFRLALVGIASAVVLAGCGSGTDSGGLTGGDRKAAQASFDALEGSNIPMQILAETATAGQIPAACRVHLVAKDTFKVYLFWVPYVGPSSYAWLDMTITRDASQDKFHLGTAPSVLPGGLGVGGLEAPVAGYIDYDRPLSKLGKQQAAVNRQALLDHAGDIFTKPGAPCEVLMNGYLRLLPNK
jgi:hypothetical protein